MGTSTTVELENDVNEIVEAVKSIEDFDNKEEAINYVVKQFKEYDEKVQQMLKIKS